MTVSTQALSNASPTLPIEGKSSSRANVSVNLIDVHCLASRVGVVNHPGSDRSAGVVSSPERHLQARFDEGDVLRRRGLPADEGSRVEIDGEGHVAKARPGDST